MLEVLADGKPHTREELHACLYDTEGSMQNIQHHISAMRKILRMQGEDIFCVQGSGPVRYIQVLLKTGPQVPQSKKS
jgi:hypothetical protein